MMSLCLTPPILMSDDKSWKVSNKVVAVVWLAIIDIIIFKLVGVI